MSKCYLITGGAGFIGSHLAQELIAQGEQVRILDDLSTGHQERLPAEAEFIKGSVTDPAILKKACTGVDGIFHLAALPRVQISIEKPVLTHEVNTTATLHVLLAARDAKVKRVVYASSAAVYGQQAVLPFHESMVPEPVNPYGAQKLMGEHYVRLASLLWGISVVSLRYFNVYGPHMDSEGAYASVMAIFLRQKAQGKPLTITGDGTQTRDFVWIDDVVRANILAMQNPSVEKGESVNIGSGKGYSVNEITKIFGGPTQSIAARTELKDAVADIRLAKELLGWEPKVSLHEGLKIMQFIQ